MVIRTKGEVNDSLAKFTEKHCSAIHCQIKPNNKVEFNGEIDFKHLFGLLAILGYKPELNIGYIAIDWADPVMSKAFDLANELVMHCQKHNLPKDAIINGLAIDAYTIIEQAKEDERVRIIKLISK